MQLIVLTRDHKEEDPVLWLNPDAIDSIEIDNDLNTVIRTRGGAIHYVKEAAVEIAFSLTTSDKETIRVA